ncbi:MAG: 50S ribosomal protein L11 methyltransferase [Deltaproteobacteria bacterium]
MLKSPHTHYQRIYTYHLKASSLPVIADADLIGVWPEGETFILFFHAAKSGLIKELCRLTGAILVYEADLDYADWETGFVPTAFSERGMTIAPVWEKTEADLFIDPSVVFGNGFHPTTRLCLRALLSLIEEPSARIDRVVDLGCGTGLLAIAAAKRGVKKVTAVDNNPLACKVALANVERNGVTDRVIVNCEDLLLQKLPTVGADLVRANLHTELLAHLMTQNNFWQASHHILSGFLPAAEERLLALLPDNVKFKQRNRMEKWCLWNLLKDPTSG